MEAPTNRLLSRVTEVKMAGFWPSSLPHFYGPKESLGHNTGIMIEYAWAIKDQIIWRKLKKKKLLKRFFAETTREIPSGQFER